MAESAAHMKGNTELILARRIIAVTIESRRVKFPSLLLPDKLSCLPIDKRGSDLPDVPSRRCPLLVWIDRVDYQPRIRSLGKTF